jgi:MscS family membrane protein
MSHRRIKETLGVRYDDFTQVEPLIQAIKQYLSASKIIAQDQIMIVNMNGYGAASIDILLYCMTVTTDWATFHEHKQQVLLDIGHLLEQHHCEFAYPTQRLQVESQPIQA